MISRLLAALSALLLAIMPAFAAPVRIKDLVEFDGVRSNDLVGYGLVVGLNGTGDGLRNSPFTEEIMTNILERLGVNVTGEQFRPNNVAAVLVTAELPPFARAGSRIDVTVSAIGDADSPLGSTRVRLATPLQTAPIGQRSTPFPRAHGDRRSALFAAGRVTGQSSSRGQRGVPTFGGPCPAGCPHGRAKRSAFDSSRTPASTDWGLRSLVRLHHRPRACKPL